MSSHDVKSGAAVAVVTGASHGIGREIAMVLAARGFVVRGIGLGRGDVDDTRREARERGAAVDLFEGDVSLAADAGRLARFAEEAGPIRAIVNNAAIRPVGTVLETSEEDWDRVFAVNVRGAFLVTRACLPAMIRAWGGAVVNVSSCSALGGPGLVAYSSSKAALLAFTRCLAEDHRGDRVRANAILPGPVRSGMTENLPAELMTWCAENGVQRRIGHPGDVANAVAFLVSPEGETITGAELRVNFWPSLFG